LDALQDQSLDKIALFANDGERDKHYLVAESYMLDDVAFRQMQEKQVECELAAYFQQLIRQRSDSVLRQLSKEQSSVLEDWIARNPVWQDDNVAYQIYRGSELNRVLLIYNTGRMVDFIEKCQLNPNASGEEGLLHKSVALTFHVEPVAKKAWLTRLYGAEQ
jgi:hypothetical protein